MIVTVEVKKVPGVPQKIADIKARVLALYKVIGEENLVNNLDEKDVLDRFTEIVSYNKVDTENIRNIYEYTVNVVSSDDVLLSERELQVLILKSNGLKHKEIAKELDITRSTVDEYSRRLNQKYEKSENTVDELGDVYDG